tara:strand:+ start:112 stop:468 length:357 start_codon:yes stop_codon:yes gene_type:complete
MKRLRNGNTITQGFFEVALGSETDAQRHKNLILKVKNRKPLSSREGQKMVGYFERAQTHFDQHYRLEGKEYVRRTGGNLVLHSIPAEKWDHYADFMEGIRERAREYQKTTSTPALQQA